MSGPIGHPVVARMYDPVIRVADRLFLERYRRALVADLPDRVLEIGAGTGAMLPYLEAASRDGRPSRTVAVEPDPFMRRRLIRRANRSRIPIDVVAGRGESLPIADDRIDLVLGVMLFCTVEHPEDVLSEIERVLRPGGELRILEHVAAEGLQGMIQRAVEPGWRRLAGGCHPTRETGRMLSSRPPLEPLEVHRLRVGVPPIRPFLYGRYRMTG